MSWMAELYDSDKTEKSNQQGLEKPYSSLIESVSSDSERVVISNWSTRGRELTVSHPFISSGSWIRALPEVGAQYMTTTRSDSSEPQLLSSFSDGVSVRTSAYRNRVGVFRSLSPGEIEVSSNGFSQSYYATRSFNSLRAGLLLRTMNQDELSIMERSPIHLQQFMNYEEGKLGDESRIGIVSRNENSWKKFYPKLNDNYIAEEFIDLKNPSLSGPTTLFTSVRGHVVDENGQVINHSETGLPLRLSQVYYSTDNTSTSFQIDQSGNYAIKLAQSATEGIHLEIPNGNKIEKVGKDSSYEIEGNKSTILKGTESKDISGSKKTTISKDHILESKSYSYKSKSSYSVNSVDYSVTASASINIKSSAEMNITSDAIAIISGKAGTTVGSGSSITNVDGAAVTLGGGALPIARIGDSSIGVGNKGNPVVSLLITGSPKVTSI